VREVWPHVVDSRYLLWLADEEGQLNVGRDTRAGGPGEGRRPRDLLGGRRIDGRVILRGAAFDLGVILACLSSVDVPRVKSCEARPHQHLTRRDASRRAESFTVTAGGWARKRERCG
jgi:hypothetical protein